jgi:ABC-2 type transport system permease protein
VLAGAVGRTAWAASHLTFAIAGPVALLVLAGLGMGLVHGANTGHMGQALSQLLGSALVQLPAVWVLAGVAAALFGLVPRLATLAWAVLAAFLLLTELGAFLGLNTWAVDVSPYSHVPKLPGGTVTAVPLLWLTVVAVVLLATGLAALRRRDLA